MTSIISPALYAVQLATKAQASLGEASAALTSSSLRPLPFPEDRLVRIPEMNGPDSPDNPWFVRPTPPMPIRAPFHVAASHATTAIQSIDRALQLGASDMLSRDVLSAFGRAREQAVAGVHQLTAKTMVPIDPSTVVLQFDGASLWLGLAKNLLQLDNGRVMRPPVTTLPLPEVEAPEAMRPQPEIEAPEAMKPEPITIQLPHPSSPIQ